MKTPAELMAEDRLNALRDHGRGELVPSTFNAGMFITLLREAFAQDWRSRAFPVIAARKAVHALLDIPEAADSAEDGYGRQRTEIALAWLIERLANLSSWSRGDVIAFSIWCRLTYNLLVRRAPVISEFNREAGSGALATADEPSEIEALARRRMEFP